jgi:hypothetical protein
VGDSSVEAEQSSPFVLLTLNWDTIPDYMIARTGGPREVSVDYGCAAHDLADAGARALATPRPSPGRFPIRLLKLHGSLNWLACPSCDRLFTSSDGGAGPPVVSPNHHSCPICQNTKLSHVIITPTLLKDLGQIHLKTVWHISLLELQEANRLVFLGYSLPLADFEFRYLLLRAMAARHDLHIRVVLYPPEERMADPRQRFERSEVEHRYRQFFGDRDLEFKYMDAAIFMADPLLLWHW